MTFPRRLLGSMAQALPVPLETALHGLVREVRAWDAIRDLSQSLRLVAPYTMVAPPILLSLGRQVRTVFEEGIPGNFVECGVWRGGTSFFMADLLRKSHLADRRVWLFDSFEGLPAPQDIDGPGALAYAQDKESPTYFDNCSANFDDVKAAAEQLGVSTYTELVKGWFNETLPVYRERVGKIAILRIDADWYSGVTCCLENLYELVSPGGFVIFDDYDAWDGCALAVHEFLASHKLPHRIMRDGCAYFRKVGGARKTPLPLIDAATPQRAVT